MASMCARCRHNACRTTSWPNPVVLKITNAEPALTPPHVQTTGSIAESSAETLQGEVLDMGDSSSLQVGL